MDQIIKVAWELNENTENRYQLVYEIAELAKKLVDETQAKSLQYFLCWSLGREDTMSVWEMNLASQHHAQKIHESLGYSIFRTSQSADELFFLKATRADYIKSALMKSLLIRLFLFIVVLICTVLEQEDNRIILSCSLCLLTLSILYTLFCLIRQMMLCKKYNDMIKKSNKTVLFA